MNKHKSKNLAMRTKRILFIIPPYFNFEDYLAGDKKALLPTFTIPYGILSLESYMRSRSVYPLEIELLDLNLTVCKTAIQGFDINIFLESSISQKLEKSFDIVGISALFNSCYNYLGKILSTIKNRPHPPLCIMGGGVASNLYKSVLRDFPMLDGICYAEGEIPMADIVNSDDYINLMDCHPSWITKDSLKNGKIVTSSYVENLDEIPMFTYDLINLDDYNGRALDAIHRKNSTKREMSIHTSRGCPFKCVYCANVALHGKKIRYMSVDRVLTEVDMMIERFNMNVLLIEDDHFLGNKKRAVQILKGLSSRNIRIEFPNGMAVYAIDDEIGFWLKEAGTTTIQLAVESGSDYVLTKLMYKPLRRHQIKKAVDILKKNGIRVHAFIVIGIPGEMDEHRVETMDMIREVGFDWVYFFIAIPVAGSRLYDICIENDYLVEKDFKNHLISKGTIKAPGVDPEKIEKSAYLMNLETNFVYNYNIRSGSYEVAQPYLQNIVQKYPNHALAHYALSECHKLPGGNLDKAEKHKAVFQHIISEDAEWRFYADHFRLTA